jgi:molecular chaperone Hsp33
MLGTDQDRLEASPGDDLVLPFRTVKSDVIGRVVRLGSVADTILSGHAYPEPVSHALGEALALTAMLGSALKTQGKFILQTKSDGPLPLLVADFASPASMRAYASFDKADAALGTARGRGNQGELLGSGHLAMTIDPGSSRERYQGIVPLARESLVDAALTYFRQSEQIPTFIRLAVARHYGPSEGDAQPVWRWRAGGLLLQKLPREGGRREQPGTTDDGLDADEENWTRARYLAATVEDHELLDPMLSPQRLLYRLFHEEGVRVSPSTALVAQCRCSRERIQLYLERFTAEELDELREPDGGFTVTCEFCSRRYRYESADLKR